MYTFVFHCFLFIQFITYVVFGQDSLGKKIYNLDGTFLVKYKLDKKKIYI